MFNIKLFLFLFIFIIPFSSGAVDIIGPTINVGEGDGGILGVSVVQPTTNLGELNVTGANFWNTTTLGPLSDANSTQFVGSGGVLSILESFIDGKWCRLEGCSITGDVDIAGNLSVQTTDSIASITAYESIADGEILAIGSGSGSSVCYSMPNIFLDSYRLNLSCDGDAFGFYEIFSPDGTVFVFSNQRFALSATTTPEFTITRADSNITDGELISRFKTRGLDSTLRDTAFIDVNADGSWTSDLINDAPSEINFRVQSGGAADGLQNPKMTIGGNNEINLRVSTFFGGNTFMRGLTSKSYQGLLDDVSVSYNTSARIIECEVGSCDNYWISFNRYLFDNNVNITGDLDLTGDLTIGGNLTVTGIINTSAYHLPFDTFIDSNSSGCISLHSAGNSSGDRTDITACPPAG